MTARISAMLTIIGTAVPERRTSMKIWTDDECIEVDPNDVGQLEAAMLFKAEHIKAKADPEMFSAVADMLSRLWDTATKRVDVVRCRECKNYVIVDEFEGGKRYMCLVNHFSYLDNDGDNQYCSYGERKGADR